jgi:hypothetical protein
MGGFLVPGRVFKKSNRSGTIYLENEAKEVIAKECLKCRELKTLKDFNRDTSKFAGRRSTCKECQKIQQHDYYKNNKPKIVNRNSNYRDKKRKAVRDDGLKEFIAKHPTTHQKLTSEGCVVKESRGNFYYYKDEKLHARECGKCKLVKGRDDYDNSKKGLGGIVTICKVCLLNTRRSENKKYWELTLKQNELHEFFKKDKDVLIDYHGKTSIYYIKDGTLLARNCTQCSVIKLADNFFALNSSEYKKSSTCKECDGANYQRYISEPSKKQRKADISEYWRKQNYVRLREMRIKRYYENRDEFLAKNRKWQMKNKHKVNFNMLRRRARKASLPDDLTSEEQKIIGDFFEGVCALTGTVEDYTWDHAIPLATGHGGTTYGNMYPLRGDLNSSKNNRNIFEWFEANRQRFELSQERFDNLIAWLASANAMSVEEYRDYVYWCHDNPRTIGELKEEAK